MLWRVLGAQEVPLHTLNRERIHMKLLMGHSYSPQCSKKDRNSKKKKKKREREKFGIK